MLILSRCFSELCWKGTRSCDWGRVIVFITGKTSPAIKSPFQACQLIIGELNGTVYSCVILSPNNCTMAILRTFVMLL